MSDETKVEQGKKADDNYVSQPIAKPHVVCSQSPEIYDAEKKLFNDETILSKELDGATKKFCTKKLKIDYANGRVWIEIDNVGVGYDKENFIALIEQSESFQFAKQLRKQLL